MNENGEIIYGIGTDQISCARVKKACESPSFLSRYYSAEERILIEERPGRAATNFAGKEAVVKALGTGFSGILPNEVVILRKENGAPYVLLEGKAKETADALGICKIHISLTDTKEYASAYAVAVCKGNR